MGQLAKMVRDKYPGDYDDLSDDELEKLITTKFPGEYDDLVTPKLVTEPTPKMSVTLPSSGLGNVPPVVNEPPVVEPSFAQNMWDVVNQPIANIRSGEFGQATEEFAQEHPIIVK